MYKFLFTALLMLLCSSAAADIVKPALVEISVYTDGHYRAEIRASIEALLTGINGKYQDTTQAPTAAEYDELRVLEAPELHKAFAPFKSELLSGIELSFDNKPAESSITKVEIPEPGYTKVPRISLIVLEGTADRSAESLTWYYPARFGDNAVRVRQVDEENERWHWSPHQWIKSDEPSMPFPLTEIFTERPLGEVVFEYIRAGFEHILPMGLDHILFILGLYLLSTHIRPLLWQVTMFTIAHSITLGLAMNGIIQLPASIVEPLIALSIAYVGIENIWHKKLQQSRLVIVFLFGLLHGMGFASVLADFGMPSDAFATALISFNIGVEFGQLAVIAIAFAATGLWFRHKSWYRQIIVVPSSLAIAMIGLYWTWDRLVI